MTHKEYAEKQEELEKLIRDIWQLDVIKSINDVLTADHFLGFKHFEMYADPSIEEIGQSLSVIEAALIVFLNNQQISPESESVLLNCQQCVHLIRRVFSSLKRDDEHEYLDAVDKLKCHAGRKKTAA